MGRKAFVNDLRDAAIPGRFAQVSAVAGGDDDGTIKFMFQSLAFSVEEIAIDAMVSGTSSSKPLQSIITVSQVKGPSSLI